MKRQNGITLIALVITIIVLLILAGVSINAVIGENGIASKAKLAKEETAIAEEKEKINLTIAEYEMESIEDSSESLEEFLKSQDWCEDAIFDDDSKMVTVTMKNGKEYEIDASGNFNKKEDSKWDSILEEANSNPEEYKHSEQLVSTYIGIGTDGKPVNMDLWNPTRKDDNSYALGITNSNYSSSDAYAGLYVDGKIQGKIPQYIYDVESEKFLPVTEMFATFVHEGRLTEAPELPETVTNLDFTFAYSAIEEAPKIPSNVISMRATFARCSDLKTACVIPASVKYTSWYDEAIAANWGVNWGTFYQCYNLTGELVIDANPITYLYFLTDVASEDGCNLVLSGDSEMLTEILATKSDNSNISIK